MVQLELCGVLGERAGVRTLELAVTTPATVPQILDALVAQYAALTDELLPAACAVVDTLVRTDRSIDRNRPLVVLPPVSGG